MKRINQDASFKRTPSVAVKRSAFLRPFTKQSTFNAGDLVPFMYEEVLPGDSHRLKISSLVRFTSSMIKPIVGEVKFTYWCFFVPSRIVWEDYSKFYCGYQDDPDWTVDPDIKIPHLACYEADKVKYTSYENSVLDHMGVHPDFGFGSTLSSAIENGASINWLPIRGYCECWNYWFRCESLQQSVYVPKITADTEAAAGIDGSIYSNNGPCYGGKLLPLNREWDYFSGGLPQPQKGASVILAIGDSAPLRYDQEQVGVEVAGNMKTLGLTDGSINVGLFAYPAGDINTTWNTQFADLFDTNVGSTQMTGGQSVSKSLGVTPDFEKSGLRGRINTADLSGMVDLTSATAISVNQLRLDVQLQRIKEADAIYGTRPNEYVYSHFGVKTPDMRHSIPEFLGSHSFYLNVNQVVQTSSNVEDSPQGNVAAYSLTQNKSKYIFSKSFSEWGYILVLGGVRVAHRIVANRGINRMLSARDRLDIYVPELAHIGFQPVLNKEIFATKIGDIASFNNEVFNYNQAWEFLRMKPNEVSGKMRPDIDGSLAFWNLSDNYESLPTFSDEWIREDRSVIDRALNFPSQTEKGEDTGVPQFIYDGYFELESIRPLPISSTPGLLDHSGKIIL